MFAKETYIRRRQQLKDTLKSGLLLFLGNDECGMNYADNTYHYRQDSTFLYFFGSDYAGLAAIIDIDEDREIIFGDELTIDSIIWMGIQPTIREKSERVGIRETLPMSELKSYLDRAAAKGQPIHYLPPYRGDHKLWLAELLGKQPAELAAGSSVPFIRAVVDQRNYKSAEEIAQIEEAINTSVEMHKTAMRMVRPGIKESEIAAAVTEVAMRQGGNLSFPVIATINGQTLHNHCHSNVLKEGQLFLLDAGAENAMHYAGDLTSTMPVSGRYTERQKTVYDINLRAYRTAVAALRPGITYREVHMMAVTEICKGMKELGLLKGDPVEAANIGAYALFMPHGLGHMMGLDVHDMENLGEVYVGYDGQPKSTQFGFKSLRLARKLEPGFVFTIEPGIYFIPELIDKWRAEKQFTDFICYDKLDAWKDFGGIRNEEDYLITTDGSRHLGANKPCTTEEIEAECNR